MGQKVTVVSTELRVASNRDQGRHEQRTAEMAVTHFADADFILHGLARAVLPRIQAGVSHPLTNGAVRHKEDQFPEQLQRALISAMPGKLSRRSTLLQLSIGSDQLKSLAG